MIKFGDKLKEELRRAEPDKERLYSMAAEAKPGRSGMRKNLIAALCAVAAVLVVVGACFYTVMSTQRGVRFAYPGEQVSVNSKDYAAVANKIAGLKKYDTYWTGTYGINGGSLLDGVGGVEADDAPVPMAPGSDSQNKGDGDYSDTNNQVSGVSEGDIVKTDGSYIYCLSRDRDGIFIFRVLEDGKLETESVTALEAEAFKDKNGNSYSRRVSAMQLWNDRLAVIYSVIGSGSEILWQSSMTRTEIIVYDITDRHAPAVLSRLSQSGTMRTSRLINGYLYVVGNMTVYSDYDKDDVYTYVPSVEYNGKNQPVKPDEILICEYAHFATYSVLSGIDLRNGQMLSSKAVLGGNSDVYASAESIYLAREVYAGAGGGVNTELMRFDLSDGVLSGAVQGSVPGRILNQFSMDEYNGYFRIVTQDIITGGDYRGNGIFILDGGLQTVGSIVDISPDERIKSVRFDGELCYFVTFRNTDPLFAVDTSVPESPKVLSKLKIPGFSVYLQTYGQDRLLGIGYEADEVSGGTTGLKLSMFDTSDKTNVKELHRLVISDIYYTSAGNEHKGVLADAKKGMVCFPCEKGYLVYSYDDADGFTKKGVIEADWGFVGYMRGLYIGDTLYVLCGRSIGVYSLENMQRLQSVELG